MKKIIIAAAILCIVALCVVLVATGYISFGKKPAEAPAEVEATAAETEQSDAGTEGTGLEFLDAGKVYDAFEPEFIVADVNGINITWADYFGWLASNISNIQNYIDSLYSYYGALTSWSDDSGVNGMTFSEYVIEATGSYIRQMAGTEIYAKEHNIVLTAEDEQAIEDALKDMAVSYCGEGATLDDFDSYLKENKLSLDFFRRAQRTSKLYSRAQLERFGEDAVNIGEDEINAFYGDQGYIYATHILLTTKDLSTGEDYDDAVKAEKLAKAQELCAELKAIKDPAALVARFGELKQEYCEDTGKTYYPDGYFFPEGKMVTEFYEGARALDEFAVSEPIESNYGYHIILRLPLSPEAVISIGNDGAAVTARKAYAETAFGKEMAEFLDGLTMTYSDEFVKLRLSDYIVIE